MRRVTQVIPKIPFARVQKHAVQNSHFAMQPTHLVPLLVAIGPRIPVRARALIGSYCKERTRFTHAPRAPGNAGMSASEHLAATRN